jgi:predicted neuraminidase
MWYKDGCQLDTQMNAKIEQSKRQRHINMHPVQRQNNHAQYLKSTSQTTIIPIF